MAKFRILSLDGGGSWALIQVHALTRIFEDLLDKGAADITGHEVLRHFDFAAANSGGTLTLAGLIHDWPLSTLLELFKEEEKRRKIFAPAKWYLRLFRKIVAIGPAYSTAKKRTGLDDIMDKNGRRELVDLPEIVGRTIKASRSTSCSAHTTTTPSARLSCDRTTKASPRHLLGART